MEGRFRGFMMSESRYHLACEKIAEDKNINTVLDVGCGDRLEDNFRMLNSKASDIYIIGVELYKENLPKISKHSKRNIDVVIADGRKLPFREGSIDVCIDFGTSKNCEEGREIISEILRVSKTYIFRVVDLKNESSFKKEINAIRYAGPYELVEYREDPFAKRLYTVYKRK